MLDSDDTPITMPLEQEWTEIRESVAKICEEYPNDYWMKLDSESEYPTEFVNESGCQPLGFRQPLFIHFCR